MAGVLITPGMAWAAAPGAVSQRLSSGPAFAGSGWAAAPGAVSQRLSSGPAFAGSGWAAAPGAVSQRPISTPAFNGTVWATAYADNTIYIGGDFTAVQVNGKLVPRRRLAAVDATTGALLSWAPEADGQVKAIATGNGAVYLAGQFASINGVKRDSLARVDADSGALHGFRHTIVGNPYALTIGSGRLYMGGSLTAVDGSSRTRLAAFRLDSGALDDTWRPVADDQVESLLAVPGRIYAGGKFHSVNGAVDTRRLAALNPTSGKVIGSFKVRAEYITYGIAAAGSRVYAAHGGQGGRVIAYDLSGARRWTLTVDGDVRAVTALRGTVYVGGHFDTACRSARTGEQGRCLDGGVSRVKLAAVDDRGRIQPWQANGNGVIGVVTMAASADLGKLAAGGAFTTVNGLPQKRFALFG